MSKQQVLSPLPGTFYRRPSPDEPVADPWHTAAQAALATSDRNGGVE